MPYKIQNTKTCLELKTLFLTNVSIETRGKRCANANELETCHFPPCSSCFHFANVFHYVHHISPCFHLVWHGFHHCSSCVHSFWHRLPPVHHVSLCHCFWHGFHHVSSWFHCFLLAWLSSCCFMCWPCWNLKCHVFLSTSAARKQDTAFEFTRILKHIPPLGIHLYCRSL